jgi:hypothetical protein
MEAEKLLLEAMEFVPEKPWDEPTLLRKRICEFFGKPVPYADYIEKMQENQSDS